MNKITTPNSVQVSNRWKAYLVFFLAASFYLYEYALQVSPSVMSDSIMSSFQVDAAGLSTISAFYFYAYAPMQIPAGVLFDKYGPRLLIALALLICVCGTVFYSITTSVAMASLGRFLIGAGSAFSFVGVLMLISKWFPARNYALMAGITQFMSSVGAICGQSPLASLSSHVGWRNSMLILASAGILLSILVWTFVRDEPNPQLKAPKKKLEFKQEFSRLSEILKNKQTWWIGLYAFAIWTPIAVFAALWDVPFLSSAYHVDPLTAASACAMIWLGIGIGSPVLGWFSDKTQNSSLALTVAAVIGIIASISLVYYPVSWSLAWVMLFAFGFAAGGQAVTFSLVRENNRPENLGTASGFNNMSVLIGGAIFQQVVGYILRLNWGHEMINNAPVYSASAYQKALCILPLCFILALIVNLGLIKHRKANQISSESKYMPAH